MSDEQENIDLSFISDDEPELSTPAVEQQVTALDLAAFTTPASSRSLEGSGGSRYTPAKTPRPSRAKSLEVQTQALPSTGSPQASPRNARASIAHMRLGEPELTTTDQTVAQEPIALTKEKSVEIIDDSVISITETIDIEDDEVESREEKSIGLSRERQSAQAGSTEEMDARTGTANTRRSSGGLKADGRSSGLLKTTIAAKKFGKTARGHLSKVPEVMTPSRVIAEYKKGNLTNQQAIDAVIRYRVNSMLHKPSDRMHVDKEGNVRPTRGMDFGKARDETGRLIRKGGLTRIEREILAYQKSTHLLIPRSIFARVVREIAQSWWRGHGPIKFTLEALSALQAATEDEITKILEISTACSYHAKRITLRIDDMRLARFCRGRQEYEFFNVNR